MPLRPLWRPVLTPHSFPRTQAPRTLPFSGLHVELGGDPDKTPAADDEEEEEEEEEEDDE